jgi:hypothetical protein
VGLHPSLSSFLALSYLIPWGVENARVFEAAREETFGHQRQSADRSHNRTNLQREAREDAGAAACGTDCGAARATPALLPTTTSEALANLLSAVPQRVFLSPGDVCSVCLEAFPMAAASAGSMVGSEASMMLRRLTPPIVALRCGHPLHVECAEDAVRAVAYRHVRCPLCREPVSLAGAVSARVFS